MKVVFRNFQNMTRIKVSVSVDCGIMSTGKRIVGGSETEVNEYPWIVALYKKGRTYPYCGGSLINSKLTLKFSLLESLLCSFQVDYHRRALSG